MKSYCTKHTASNNKWALNNFQEWFVQRKTSLPKYESRQPLELLLTDEPSELSHILSMYVKETRKVDGSEYTPKTLYLLLAGLQRQIRLNKGRASSINIFSDPLLDSFYNVCDHEFQRLRLVGIGAKVSHIEPLSKDDENSLWESKVLCLSTPNGLLNCVFIYNGKNLCLRGGDEHCQLKFSQLRREVLTVDGVSKSLYIYTEHGSKNRSGGFGELHVQNKVVRHFEVPEAGDRSYVKILDLYLSKVPKEAIEKDNFYVRPVTVVGEGKPWFSSVPVGKNKLATMVKTMCSKAGLQGNKTNHSLRSFGVSSLFQENVPEKIIQERSGHRSVSALRMYEKTTSKQLIEASRVLSCIPSQSIDDLPEPSDGKPDSPRSSDVKPEPDNMLEQSDPKNNMFRGSTFSNCTFQLK
ncbi:PREDICTED: glutamine-rich protein 1-like [Amphimedon queenslandica]|uniref:Uncharacterized protein n=1 Tax=Amphimedon queenslandica TaxID=400682 RepID=A0A1X7U1T2_AMPQE|nr:PREDICTED: glutamine-rich protein 1-like [Amphimedon queenslandica]|eukprot:XP_011406250.1 PREDICTED: glutamine-rich protein 1-like [Amphimedon queenslandica]